MPERLWEKWSHCPRGFQFNLVAWTCPHCQKYINPGIGFGFGRSRLENMWIPVLISEEGRSDVTENWNSEWAALPAMQPKHVNDILSTGNYPSTAEIDLRLYAWRDAYVFSQYDLAEIKLQKEVLFNKPSQYFYYKVFGFLRFIHAEKFITGKTFDHVRKLILDEADIKQWNANREEKQKPNLHRLLELLPNEFEFERAEIYRNLGRFDECLKTLQSVDTTDPFRVDLKKEMIGRAKRKDSRVFKIEDGLDQERGNYHMQ